MRNRNETCGSFRVAAAAQAAPDVSILVNNAGILLATPVLLGYRQRHSLAPIRDRLVLWPSGGPNPAVQIRHRRFRHMHAERADLVRASRYDWRRLEAEINSFGNYRTLLDGLGVHFIHAEAPDANALPLILTHG